MVCKYSDIFVSYVYSFIIESKIAYWSQEECKSKFIFTQQDVQYCSDIYPIDVFLISLGNNPISYLCLITGLYIIGFFALSNFKTNKKNN